MFAYCNELEYLDLSNFNTSKVIDKSYMFYKCYKLKEIKGIYNFRIADMTDLTKMFDECNDLEYISYSTFGDLIPFIISSTFKIYKLLSLAR